MTATATAATSRPDFEDSGDWFKADIDRQTLIKLSQRSDRLGLRRIGAYFALLGALGVLSVALWGSWWFLAAYAVFCFVWSFANAVGHEACHYTPFASRRLNDAVLYVTAWMLNMEPVTERWVHARHHSFTSMVDDDAEYLLPNPISRRDFANLLFGTNHFWNYNKELVLTACRRPTSMIVASVPAGQGEMGAAVRNARLFLALYGIVIVWSVSIWSPLPFVMLMLPRVVGEPMHGIVRILQHGGLETEVADHRRTTRSMYVSRPFQWIYLNMNFHIEHHMFPMVPFHALPQLHSEIKDQLPEPSPGIWAGMTEVVRAMRRQRIDSSYRIPNRVPQGLKRLDPGSSVHSVATASPLIATPARKVAAAVVDVCALAEVPKGDVIGVECDGQRYAVGRTSDGTLFAVSDTCTHQKARLSEGLLTGCELECPMHQGRFDVLTGEPTRRPARRPLATYPVEVVEGRVQIRATDAARERSASAEVGSPTAT